MTNHVLLNNITHKDLKVITDRSEQYGDNVMFTTTFPLEFRNVQAHYPIFFQKNNKTGSFYPIVLFGFNEKENLFLSENGWAASYIPLTIERHPFLIGFQQFHEEGISKKQMVIHIDMDNPRVNETEGEVLFMPQGGNTRYLEHVASVLEAVHYGYEHSEGFIAVLLELDLLESFTLDIQLSDGSNNQIQGFYTINEDKLVALNGELLAKLHSKGYLQAIYMVVASHSNIRKLIDEKNKRLKSVIK